MTANTINAAKEERACFIPFDNFKIRFEQSPNGKGIIILIDIDDFLVKMADLQQEMLDKHEFKNGVRFKTKTIKMLEQLRHNCDYLIGEVKKEVNSARLKNAIPDLGRFPTFRNYVFDINDPDRYEKVLKHVETYKDVAKELYDQFFEERDVCLEIDNLNKGETLAFDLPSEHEQIKHCQELIDKNKEAFKEISIFCLGEGKRLSTEAQSKNHDNVLSQPDYGPLFRMDSNDVLKKGDLELTDKVKLVKYKEHVLYEKPIQLLENCVNNLDDLNDIVTNEAVFSMESEEVIDFDAIYNIENVIYEAVDYVHKLVKLLKIAGVPVLGIFLDSHHTGGRESASKIKLGKDLFPDIDGIFLQYFHDKPHNVKRRGRSSKFDYVIKVFDEIFGKGVITSDMLHLSDDSDPNTKDGINKGGICTHYKPQTDAEIINDKIEGSLVDNNKDYDTAYVRMTGFDDHSLVTTVFMIYERYRKLCKESEDINNSNGVQYKKRRRST